MAKPMAVTRLPRAVRELKRMNYQGMQRETTETHTAIVFSAEPVFAALVSLVARKELPGAWEVVGGALILGGILAIQYGTARRELVP
jgi:drug/metabolite transporter (DMT)-like permease